MPKPSEGWYRTCTDWYAGISGASLRHRATSKSESFLLSQELLEFTMMAQAELVGDDELFGDDQGALWCVAPSSSGGEASPCSTGGDGQPCSLSLHLA
jgi:hypothetical protein